MIQQKIMTTHKAFALLYFLLCFCFLSTGYAQPCLADNNSVNESNCQLSIEDTPESNAILSSDTYRKPFGHARLFIENSPLENRKNHTLPCCNRGPPLGSL